MEINYKITEVRRQKVTLTVLSDSDLVKSQRLRLVNNFFKNFPTLTMQSKIIAAAVASTAAAIKLEAPTTMLAQAKPLSADAGVDTDCHGTYMYQCMQKKVDDALGFLVFV